MQLMRLTRSFMGLLAFGLSLMPIAARADVAALFADLDSAQPNRGLAQMMVIGIAEGFDTVNDQLKASQHPALYCSPDKLNGDQLIDILRKWVKANRAKSPRIDKAPPGVALLYALQDAFPCSK
jgi:Ssp1 endopeptidase immunity protein Rap1a